MKATTLSMMGAGLIWIMGAANIQAHCEIPCGIFGDEARLNAIAEHADTIEKSMKQIVALSVDPASNANQIARWVMNKETHANEVQKIVTQYFMAQRIKVPAADDANAVAKYNTELGLLHQMLVQAMKAKQSTDTAHTDALRSLAHNFGHSYMGAHVGGGEH